VIHITRPPAIPIKAPLPDLRRSRQPPKFRRQNRFSSRGGGWLLRRFGARIGRAGLTHPSVQITWKYHDVVLSSLGEIHIGKNSVISQHFYFCSVSHDPGSVAFDKPINIGSQCWPAGDVFVGPVGTIADAAEIGGAASCSMICHGNPVRLAPAAVSAPATASRRLRCARSAAPDEGATGAQRERRAGALAMRPMETCRKLRDGAVERVRAPASGFAAGRE
jgi:putative colanic acid biosynthesis acetyltransferase WcaF